MGPKVNQGSSLSRMLAGSDAHTTKPSSDKRVGGSRFLAEQNPAYSNAVKS